MTANLFLVGAPRAGTSSLFEYLSRHPAVFAPTEKEPHHFDSDVLDGRAPMSDEEYLALYADARSERWALDASALYLYSAEALDAVSAMPDSHAIISLRDPVEQMASWHGLMVATGSEAHTSLEEALAAESADMPFERRYSEIARYAPHVERWLDRLGADRVHVLVFEELTGSGSDRVCGDLLAGLGLDGEGLGSFPRLNTYRRPAPVRLTGSQSLVRAARAVLPQGLRRTLWSRANAAMTPHATRPQMPDALRARLRRDVDADVRRLESLVGRDLHAIWSDQQPSS